MYRPIFTGVAMALFVLATVAPAGARFFTYTSLSDFLSRNTVDYQWDFEELVPDSSLVTDVSGPGSATMVRARVAVNDSHNYFPSQAIVDNYVYFNPQAANGDFVFSSPVHALGLSVTWGDFIEFNQVISAAYYDKNDNVLGILDLTSANALGSYFKGGWTWYDGFFGASSSKAIHRLKIVQQRAGGTLYDNLIWAEKHAVPEPATFLLVAALFLIAAGLKISEQGKMIGRW